MYDFQAHERLAAEPGAIRGGAPVVYQRSRKLNELSENLSLDSNSF